MKKLSKVDVAALAGNIRAAREKMGMSQGAFARAVGVTQQTVSDWEHGRGLQPVVVAWRLADVLAEAT